MVEKQHLLMSKARFISKTIMEAKKLILLRLLLILQLTFCTSMDSINSSQTIKEGDLLISRGKVFALGFFSPGSSSYRYLGIWYHKVPEQTVVWVANRNNPIIGSTGVLSFDEYGNLILSSDNNQKVPLWSTNFPGDVAHSCVAQLLDSGNLVLVEGESGRILWQSFDYPTNVHLPGMKLGLDRNTGVDRFLISWKSADDPATGDYVLKVNPNGSPQFFLYKGKNPSWRTAPWPWKSQSNLYHVMFLNNQAEISFSYTVPHNSVIMRKMLDHSGVLSVARWHESDGQWKEFWKAPQFRCDFYGKCGAHSTCQSADVVRFECACLPGYEPKYPRDWFLRDGSGGCVRKRLESSSVCGQGEGFVRVENVFLPDTSAAVWVGKSMNQAGCEQGCKRNCSCSAYSIIDFPGNQSGCLTWYGELTDIISDREERSDLYIRVDAVELAEIARKSNAYVGRKKLAIIVVTVSSASLVIISIFTYLWLRKWKQKGNLVANMLLKSSMNSDVEFFKLSTISAATNSFSPDNKLGQGGFGIVYKGQLPNEQEVAIKRLSRNSGQGVQEFKNEVTVIAKLQHRNLVKLLGCCIQGGEQMLIFEYMPNKSLDSFLFDETRKSVLDWQKRFDIIVGIARGILYLHQDSRLRIIHRDLKCSNILLDAEMNPKIADFGLARIFEGDQVLDKTNRVVGTFGYMSPEYAAFGKFSVKSDVFSFGVMLLEIVSGKKNNRFNKEDPSMTLIGHVWELWGEDRALEVVDSSLKDLYHPQEALKCIQIGLLCVQEAAMERPSMLAVVFMLSTSETTLPSPKKPAFILKESCNNPQVAVDVAEGGTCSLDDLTMTGILSH